MSVQAPSPVQLELLAMREKADQEVSSHSFLRDHFQGWGQRLNIYTLFCSALLLVFTLATDDFMQRTVGLSPDAFKASIGSLAFVTFCLSLVALAWNPVARAKAHDQAVGHYLRMNYELRNLLGGERGINRDSLRRIQEEYLDAADLPRIPEAMSLLLKQRHLLKLAMARALEQNPHQALWWLRIKLWWAPLPAAPPPAKAAKRAR
jgi:hypothetical protein